MKKKVEKCDGKNGEEKVTMKSTTNQCSYAYGHADLDRCTHVSTYLRGQLDYVREQFESREKKNNIHII